MDENNKGSFWPSYVDIMTTLFAIMLVLFAVSFSRFKIKEQQLSIKERQLSQMVETLEKTQGQLKEIVDEYENILAIYSIVGKIDETEYFGYNKEYLKHLFQINVEYQTGAYAIDMLELDRTDKMAANRKRESIIAAGKMVQETIMELNRLMPETKDNNIKFLVIIEGQSSKIRFEEGPYKNNYTLSYLRAQYLNEFWKKNGINLDAISRCEVIIAGSGEEGVPREIPNVAELRRLYPDDREFKRQKDIIEKRNQRFLINIVPVLGNIDGAREKINRVKGKQ